MWVIWGFLHSRRTCEEEWGTLMFFCDYQGQVEHKPRERLSPCVESTCQHWTAQSR